MFLSWMEISGNWNYFKVESGQELINFLYFTESFPGNFHVISTLIIINNNKYETYIAHIQYEYFHMRVTYE